MPSYIESILQMFPQCKYVMTDNESVFTSHVIENLFQRFKITHVLAPSGHSTSNGQVERFHSTILEIAKCLSQEKNETFSNVLFEAIGEYNCTIHSVTKEKPVDIFFNSSKYTETTNLLQKAQDNMLKFQNEKRTKKKYIEGQQIYVKGNRRNKIIPPYTKHQVVEDKKKTQF